MGKYRDLKKVAQQSGEKMDIDGDAVSDSNDLSSSDVETMNSEEDKSEKSRTSLWINRERVLILCSRGADVRTRHLMRDIKMLLPHSKGDSKLDKQKSLVVINDIAEMMNCTKVLFFESRKHKDVYLWMSNVQNGPSVKFLVHNMHTMLELKLSGNCLKASRPILSFDSRFDDELHLTLIKHVLMQIFSTPNHHPRSQPFIDHVFSFSVTPDLKIWFRNFQIVDETLQLQEIGPRFVLETIRIFAGSFNGAVLYDNPDYESPNLRRRALRLVNRGKYIEKELMKKVADSKAMQIKEVIAEKLEDPVGEVFDTSAEPLTGAAKRIAAIICKKKRKKNTLKTTKYDGSCLHSANGST
ncbi:brix domain protein [Dictyocaulus viviparus]|uniref:Ribosome biogenesis protein BRX1 homolog n=1 Tax=Dictyocaulus viviparus TaxID=29172 RepID=A0A0D8Y245_DICVI|nr:brix domain protein [Dictyocaulus viviparus]